MGLGGLHFWQMIILAFIVVVVFGTKKLKTFGEDLGGAIHGFKKAMDEGKEKEIAKEQDKLSSVSTGHTVDVKAEKVETDKSHP